MSRVYLVRHAAHGLLGKVLAGRQQGVSLSAEGRAQAERLAQWMASRDIARIVSSPLERCRETVEPLATRLGQPVLIDDALHEIDCGRWTGTAFGALENDPRWHVWNNSRAGARTPGGESTAEVRERVMALITEIADEDRGPVVLTSHSDVIKIVVQTLLGASLDWHDRLVIDPASITTVDLWPGGGKVVRTNEEARP